MFRHLFTYRLKYLLRQRSTLFWGLFFPILLAIFFNMAIRGVTAKAEKFQPISTAVVNDSFYQKDASFRSALKSVSKGKDQIFTLTETSKENAKKLLADKKIEGYFTAGSKIGLTFNDSDVDQSIMKTFADSYMQTVSTVTSIMAQNPAAYQSLAESLKTKANYLENKPIGNANPDNGLFYFYALIAMACLYSGFWGLKEITDIQANLSHRAARINLAPVHKMKVLFSGMLASLAISWSEMLLLLVFLRYALKIDFGQKAGFVIFTAFLGCIVGLSAGAFLSAIVKSGENLKIGILVSVIMLGCVFSGMMYENLKYIIQKNAPVLGYLNPVNLLTDSFYCLYYYTDYSRYWLNIGLLCAFIAAFCTVTYLIIRRQKYASL